MEIDDLIRTLDDPMRAESWLRGLGLRAPEQGHRFLADVAEAGVPLDLLSSLATGLERELPLTLNADLALANLGRFIQAARSPLSLATLFDREPESLRPLLEIGSTSKYLSEQLIQDQEILDLLRLTLGQPVAKQVLIDEICAETEFIDAEHTLAQLLRRFKKRETLRIAYGDIVRRQPVDVVGRQLSHLADAIVEAAFRFASRNVLCKRGERLLADRGQAKLSVLGLGGLGGEELSYSNQIELIFVCDEENRSGRWKTKDEHDYFSRVAKLVVDLLSEPSDEPAYVVDLSMRPKIDHAALVVSRDAALRYYDVSGRTFERQAFVKARLVAGSAELGASFLRQMEPWVYGRYLNSVEISGVKAFKRKIEHRADRFDQRDIRLCPGGIRDIEFVIQFLQLLNGGDLASVRTGNTIEAIRELERAGCLTNQERTLLEDNYVMLRRTENRVQTMFGPHCTDLPTATDDEAQLAAQLDYRDVGGQTAGKRFSLDLNRRRDENRQIIDHLLHDAFADADEANPITDLILDPFPEPDQIARLLGEFGFRDVPEAYRQLAELSQERIPFLSTRRCRHFLAGIAPRLLTELSKTPDPDGALRNLSQVSDSLGGKGVLWELFSYSPPTLRLYVRLCSTSDYLTSILNAQPGMIDELMDSLVLDRLVPPASLSRQLNDLCRGADDLAPVLSSFKNLQHLRIGVRDLLGKNALEESHEALSDVADTILRQVADVEYQELVQKHGAPMLADATRPADFMIVALGKLGAQEPNYHSDLDLVFLYEGGGQTAAIGRPQKQTTNQHFFSQLSQRIIRRMTQLGATGRLYELGTRLRPSESSGLLAFSLSSLLKFFQKHGDWALRLSLCKARIVSATQAGGARAIVALRAAQFIQPWSHDDQQAMLQERRLLESSASPRNLKRGPGGTIDVELIVQQLQMKHAQTRESLIVPNTLRAISTLAGEDLLDANEARTLSEDYRFLRMVELRLRLLNTAKRHDLPTDLTELHKLAYLLELSNVKALEDTCASATVRIREAFNRHCRS